ncbi:MAG TPA: 4-(cytidine 5'-diphospho)-2-C-methyl-D-erythritol kinase [Acidobacteriota bacterium]|nr:4-(cytidine 5'-diphospho)-2-C-methyl-D-erythritol kinase [Acidobacteriota bacterium]HRR25695.1 4-(cytidine 5'-diphospho)-2-C-methyl-D-erythritol kinase [Acidobacteriota bacterium]HRV07166.1 4-(cytidine 5'-diphospho)-2-C-methyl-D-erythritol kinase [Acidobacteriota bacterium]
MSTPAVVLPAYAKVNWWLEILGRRSDDYHELFTIFETVSLADTVKLTLETTPGIRLETEGWPVPCDLTNLAWRAAESLMHRVGYREGLHIRLEKRIPPGAGLGGGSSDAAAVLSGLNTLLGGVVEDRELAETAAELGSDVPFFLRGGVAVGTGRGEKLHPLPRSHYEGEMLIFWPGFSVSTGEAYSWLQVGPWNRHLTGRDLDTRMRAFQQLVSDCRWGELRNDFQSVVFSRYPVLGEIQHLLLAAGAGGALLAGSGSALFAIGPKPALQQGADACRSKWGGASFMVTTIRGRVFPVGEGALGGDL